MRESGAALEYTAVGQAPQAGGQDYTKGLRPLKPRRKSLSREYIALTSLKSALFSLFRTIALKTETSPCIITFAENKDIPMLLSRV